MADDFTEKKLSWLEAVGRHHGMSTTAYRVAILIALYHLNRKKGFARVGYPALALALDVTERAVMRAVAYLEDAGFLDVRRFPGRDKANEYRLRHKGEKGDDHVTFSEDDKRDENDTFSSVKRDGRGTENVTTATAKRDGRGKKNVTQTSPQPYGYEPNEEPIDGNPLSRKRAGEGAQPPASDPLVSDATDADRMFEAIFDRWLKRSGEREARRAFMQALADGADPEAIARGAAAYLADRRRDRRGPAAVIQFTTPMARWLDDRAWETWASLPDAERRAAEAAGDETAKRQERAVARAALRASVYF